mmetsp:Transcript_21079/g.58082  ORF Transcript_21079/g.58082 Transcript_21079/m.58082 type:complete len:85 (+) Transcript_21079:817-1071(+)
MRKKENKRDIPRACHTMFRTPAMREEHQPSTIDPIKSELELAQQKSILMSRTQRRNQRRACQLRPVNQSLENAADPTPLGAHSP